MRSRNHRSRRRLRAELLEDRRLLVTFTVTTLSDLVSDDGQTSLREAVTMANDQAGRDTIEFESALFQFGPATLTLSTNNPSGVTHLLVDESLTLEGPGAMLLNIDAQRNGRHFVFEPANANQQLEAEITGISFARGVNFDTGDFAGGGSIAAHNTELTITESEIGSSTATDDGGAILFVADAIPGGNLPKLTVLRSTIANNTSGDNGGGISVLGMNGVTPEFAIDNSTISNNRADNDGGGIYVSGVDVLARYTTITGNHSNNDDIVFTNPVGPENDVIFRNSIIAGNFSGSGTGLPSDLSTTVSQISENNLIGDAATSGGLTHGSRDNIVGIEGIGTLPINVILNTTLEFNNGTTRSHALVDDSPAIDAATPLSILIDQRDVIRPQGDAPDIGSVERILPNTPPTITAIADITIDVNDLTPQIPFEINDAETPTGGLVVTAAASDTNLIPAGGIMLRGAAANRTIQVRPAVGLTGTATISVTVTDEAGATATETFDVIVVTRPSDPVIRISPGGPSGAPDPADLPSGPQPTSWAQQRSSLRRIEIDLGTPITGVTAADLVLTNLGVNAATDPDSVITLRNDQLALIGGGTQIVLELDAGQLTDGVYQLDLLPAITGGDTFTLRGDAVNRFFVLTGDWNGSGGVNIQDFATFAYWFGQSVPDAPHYVDLNDSGGVNIQDFAGFAGNFGAAAAFPGFSTVQSDGASEGELLVRAASVNGHDQPEDFLESDVTFVIPNVEKLFDVSSPSAKTVDQAISGFGSVTESDQPNAEETEPDLSLLA